MPSRPRPRRSLPRGARVGERRRGSRGTDDFAILPPERDVQRRMAPAARLEDDAFDLLVADQVLVILLAAQQRAARRQSEHGRVLAHCGDSGIDCKRSCMASNWAATSGGGALGWWRPRAWPRLPGTASELTRCLAAVCSR